MEESDNLRGLTEMLKVGNRSAGNDVIFRAGTSNDVLTENDIATKEKKYWEPTTDGNTL
jgi:hypothetical protein